MRVIQIPRNPEGEGTRVAAYVRVSSTQESQEDSLENQTRHYRAVIGSDPRCAFAGIYSDQKSGTEAMHRAGFIRMMEDALAGKFDRLLVKSVSRFSRNTLDTYHYLRVLNTHGVSVFFEKEGTEVANAYTSVAFSLSAAAAQHESYSISENVRRANRKRYDSGRFSARRYECLGYTVVDGKLKPNESAWIVREIYRLFLAGYSRRRILAALEAKNPSSVPLKLDSSTLGKILRNETYMGDIKLLKTPQRDLFTKERFHPEPIYIRGDHEAIVEPELWQRVQARLEASRRGRQECRSRGGMASASALI